MLKKNCFIVEDNKEDLELLTFFIKRTSFLSVVGHSDNFRDALSFLHSNPVDILFLDINLSGKESGLDIIRTMPVLPSTIITSNYRDYAVESYEFGTVTDYLLKAYTFERFIVAVNRAMLQHTVISPVSRERCIFLKMGRKFQKFNFDNILFFEGFGIYAKVHEVTSKVPSVINETITTLIDILDKGTFMRVHKLYIVNIAKISGFDSGHVFVEGQPIPVGGSYKDKLESFAKVFTRS